MCLGALHIWSMPTVHGKKNSSAPIWLLMSARAAGWATSSSLAAVSQMTTKPPAGNAAAACKFGRMTLPAYHLAQAESTHSRRRWRNRLYAERGKTQAWSTRVE